MVTLLGCTHQQLVICPELSTSLVSTWRATSTQGTPSRAHPRGCHPPRTLLNPCHHHKHSSGPPWPPGSFLVALREKMGQAAAWKMQPLAPLKAKTKGFGEPRSLEKEVRCFSLVDVSFHSRLLIRAQTTCGPIPTMGWQCLPSYQLGIVHGAAHSREKKYQNPMQL